MTRKLLLKYYFYLDILSALHVQFLFKYNVKIKRQGKNFVSGTEFLNVVTPHIEELRS